MGAGLGADGGDNHQAALHDVRRVSYYLRTHVLIFLHNTRIDINHTRTNGSDTINMYYRHQECISDTTQGISNSIVDAFCAGVSV